MAAGHVSVRRASSLDSESAVGVIVDAIRGSAAGYYSDRALEAWATAFTEPGVRRRIDETDAVVAEDRSRLVGFINLDGEEIDLLFVAPSHGGRGVARRLHEQVDRVARSRGLGRLTATASLRAEPVFRHLGFRSAGRSVVRAHGIDFEVAKMSRDLNAGRARFADRT